MAARETAAAVDWAAAAAPIAAVPPWRPAAAEPDTHEAGWAGPGFTRPGPESEAGYRAGRLTWVNSYFTSKSVCQEVAHLYVGRDLVAVGTRPDETEFMELATLPFDEVYRMVLGNEIRDSMSVIAILLAGRERDAGRG